MISKSSLQRCRDHQQSNPGHVSDLWSQSRLADHMSITAERKAVSQNIYKPAKKLEKKKSSQRRSLPNSLLATVCVCVCESQQNTDERQWQYFFYLLIFSKINSNTFSLRATDQFASWFQNPNNISHTDQPRPRKSNWYSPNRVVFRGNRPLNMSNNTVKSPHWL